MRLPNSDRGPRGRADYFKITPLKLKLFSDPVIRPTEAFDLVKKVRVPFSPLYKSLGQIVSKSIFGSFLRVAYFGGSFAVILSSEIPWRRRRPV